MSDPPDEFDWIERGLVSLARNAPEAFGLTDDVPPPFRRLGFDLIVSKDAIVEGAFPPRRRARSGRAQAGAGHPLTSPLAGALNLRAIFSRGLACGHMVREREALVLLSGERSIPLWLEVAGRRHGRHARRPSHTASLIILGWTLAGRMVRRADAEPGDVLLGQWYRGRRLARAASVKEYWNILRTVELARGSLSPAPLQLGLAEALRQGAHAAIDVSDVPPSPTPGAARKGQRRWSE